MIRCNLWLRASGPDQSIENQRGPLSNLADARGWDVIKVYELHATSAYRGEQQQKLREALADAQSHRYDVLVVWALDRLNREGALATLQTIHRLGQAGVKVVSLQEPWLETAGDFMDVLLAITGWVANMESRRRSERTLAGLERARASGRKLGRPPGAKDTKKRRRSGYLRNHEDMPPQRDEYGRFKDNQIVRET